MLRMKLPSKHKIFINRHVVFQYAFILCVILNFRSVWVYTESLAWTSRLVKLLMGLSVAGGVIARNKLSLKNTFNCFCALGVVLAYGMIWYLVDALKSNSIITIVVQLLALVVYCILVEDSIEDTMRKYTNIVIFIAVVSLFFWVFGSLSGLIHSTGYSYSTWSGGGASIRIISYYGIYYETQQLNFLGLLGSRIVRNTAIFTEAPMASMIFSTAFLYELLIREKIEWRRCVILVVAVMSTFSTTGYTVLIIAVALRYVLSGSKTRGSLSIKLLFLPMAFLVALVALNFLVGQKLGTGSGSTRLDDFVAGYKAWMDSPLFGNGYGNAAAYQQYMSSFRSRNLGFSNSPMQVLTYGGIFLFAPYCIAAVIGLTQLAKRRAWRKLSFYLVFIYSFVITVCPFQMLTLYIFISLAREGRKAMAPQMTTGMYKSVQVPLERG